MHNIQVAINALQNGRPVLIVDDQKRENEGDLVIACQTITEASTNFLVKHSSGIVCMATTGEQLQRLGLPQIESPHHKRDKQATAFAYSFEASSGITTGISAKDRAYSLHIAARPDAKKSDILSPGHLFPLKAVEGGLDNRQGHTEAAVDLCQLAGLWPSAAISEVPDENGDMLKGDKLTFFAQTYNIPLVTTAEVIAAKRQSEALVVLEAQSHLPTKFGDFNIQIWREGKKEHIAIIKGNVKNQKDVLVRIHSQCLTGDVFASKKCDCQSQLHHALNAIENAGQGVVLWLRQEGRGIGLTNKIKAYALQEQGLNTVEANKKLGLPTDSRSYKVVGEILQNLGIKSVCLITNNPYKLQALEGYYKGKINHIPSVGERTQENSGYLDVKKEILGHLI